VISPGHSSNDFAANLSVVLTPGWYALVFGSGSVGATGIGVAPNNNSDIGSPSYITASGGAYQDSSISRVRFFLDTPNDIPTANAGGPYTVPEGGSITLSGSGSDPDGSVATFQWDLNYNGITFDVDATVASPTFSAVGLDGPSPRTVALRVIDNLGAASNIATATVNITNVAPVIVPLNGPFTINENGTVTLNGSFTDPGTADTHTVAINWGDGSPITTLTLPVGARTFSASHLYLDDNPTGTPSDPYTISGNLSDNSGASVPLQALVTPPGIVNQTGLSEGRQILHFSPTGQTFIANSTAAYSIGLFIEDANSHIAPTDFTIDFDLYAGIGTGGALLGTRTFSGLSDFYNGFADVDFSAVSLTPGSTYTVIVRNDNARWFLRYSGNQYSGGTAIVSGSPVASEDAGFRITWGPMPAGSLEVTVNNVAPSALGLSLSAPTINENGSVTLSGSFTDPGTLDTHTVVINWGDGSPNTTLSLPVGARTFSASHPYLDDSPGGTPSDTYPISVTVTDDDTGSATASTSVTVNNVAPANVSLNAPTIAENGTATLTGSFTDPGTLDPHTVVIAWGPGEGSTTLTLAAGVLTFSANHQYLDDNPTGTASDSYPISVTVTDDDTGSGTGSTSVTVNNVAPSGMNLSLSATSITENGSITLTGSFTDPGTLDPHTVVITWGPGEGSTTLTLAAGVLTFSASHQYLDDNPTGTASDSYPISVTVADDDTGSGPGSTSATVNNAAPSVALNAVAAINENSVATLSGSITDPGTLDTFTLAIQHFAKVS
jgi:hypothetical protein